MVLRETYHLWEEDEICSCPMSHAYNVLSELLAHLKGFISDLQVFAKDAHFSERMEKGLCNLGSAVQWKPKSTTCF